jgi:ribosomal protein L33
MYFINHYMTLFYVIEKNIISDNEKIIFKKYKLIFEKKVI